MTKDQFRAFVLAGMESLLALPDDLFTTTYPTIRLKLRQSDGQEVVVVGVETPDAYEDARF